MNTEFTTISIEGFNTSFGTELTKDMDFSEACDNMEENGVNQWYVSLDKEDVLEDYRDNSETIARNMYTLEFYFIDNLAIYISIY